MTRKVSRLVLKDGTLIDADSVWEDNERITYRLGKMQAFVDRSEVKNVYRDITLKETKPAAGLNLRFSTGNLGLDQLIVYSATRYQMDPLLIYLVMREESGFNYRAVSHAGARGLMQLMPGTAKRLGVRNIHDPVENVEAGTRYLRGLLDMFGGDVNLALAAYNAGEDAVIRYGRRIPPYRETTNYVWRINAAYHRAMSSSQNAGKPK
jgi:soluble lytic murein transglycosylase-like protein